MVGDLRSAKTSSSLERKKKISIKGVLDKRDLAETYNCTSKKGWKKHSSASNLPAMEHQLRVNSVDFKEATIEDLLPKTETQHTKGGHYTKHQESGTKFYEAVRRVSQVDQSGSLAPNKLIQRSSSQANGFAAENTTSAVAPSGYEPENSLRRASVAVRPSQLQREGGLRRRSALDRPHILSKEQTRAPSTNNSASELTYEPENSLSRRRKVSDGSKSSQGRARNRRVGVVLENPMAERKSPVVDQESISNRLETSDTSPSQKRSPVTPRSSARNKLTALSIPENEEMQGDCSVNSPSPRHRRKISQKLPNIALERTHSTLTGSSSSPKLQRIYSSPSLVNHPTSPPKLRLAPSSPSIDIQTATNSIKARRSSTSSLPSPMANNKSLGRSTKSSPSISKKVRREDGLSVERQMSSKRHWEWYLLQVSYSWQSFNTDNHYCY